MNNKAPVFLLVVALALSTMIVTGMIRSVPVPRDCVHAHWLDTRGGC